MYDEATAMGSISLSQSSEMKSKQMPVMEKAMKRLNDILTNKSKVGAKQGSERASETERWGGLCGASLWI